MNSLIKTSFIILAINIAVETINSQEYNLESNFWEMVNDYTSRNKPKIKKFNRFFQNWYYRLDSNGDFSKKLDEDVMYYKAFNDAKKNKSSSLIDLQWEEVGATKFPNGYSFARGVGRVDFVTFNPRNPDTMLACSPAGGVFKSFDNGLSWKNANTDNQLANIAVSHILIDKHNPDNTWLIATGSANQPYGNRTMSGIYPQSHGVYKTTNAGNSWQHINLYPQESSWFQIKKLIQPSGEE